MPPHQSPSLQSNPRHPIPVPEDYARRVRRQPVHSAVPLPRAPIRPRSRIHPTIVWQPDPTPGTNADRMAPRRRRQIDLRRNKTIAPSFEKIRRRPASDPQPASSIFYEPPPITGRKSHSIADISNLSPILAPADAQPARKPDPTVRAPIDAPSSPSRLGISRESPATVHTRPSNHQPPGRVRINFPSRPYRQAIGSGQTGLTSWQLYPFETKAPPNADALGRRHKKIARWRLKLANDTPIRQPLVCPKS